MSRKRNNDEGSLELLLDTICNMFGGVVLIAVLLAVLSREAGVSRAHEVVPPEVAHEQRVKLAALSNGLERVEGELANFSDVEKGPIEAVSEEEIKEIEKKIVAKGKEKKHGQIKKGDLEDEIRKIQDLIDKLDNEEEQQVAQTEVRVPVARKMDKSSVLVFLKNGRYYPAMEMSRNGVPGDRKLDSSVCVAVQMPPNRVVVMLKKDASGQSIKGEVPSDGFVGAMLKSLNKKKEMLVFIVSEDSFSQFNLLKKHIASAGINYNWIPRKSDESFVTFITDSGNDGVGM